MADRNTSSGPDGAPPEEERALLAREGAHLHDARPHRSTTVRLVPCPGRYNIISTGKLRKNTGQEDYSANFRLSHPSRNARPGKCGKRLPRSVGRARATFTVGASKLGYPAPLTFSGRRRGDGTFEGELRLTDLLCGRHGVLVRVSAGHSVRVFRYTLTTSRVYFRKIRQRQCDVK